MWEFSLYFPKELLSYFNNFKTELKNICKDEKNCISLSIQNEQYSLLLALTKKCYQNNILFIKQKIIEIILLFYKPKTIAQSIKNFNTNEHQNIVLLDILSSFDYQIDFDEIYKKFSLCKKLYLDSFVIFKLQSIIKRWTEVGNLINQNSLFLLDSTIKKGLMKFLLDGIVCQMENIKITNNDGKINLFNCGQNITQNRIFYGSCEYDSALFTLISKFPKQIEIENHKSFDVNFIEDVFELFGNKVKLS